MSEHSDLSAENLLNKQVFINCRIAMDLNTSSQILEELSNIDKVQVKCRVAENPNTPLHILEKLSKDHDFAVRWAVAKNPNISDNLLMSFHKDEYSIIRNFIANHPKTTIEILKILVKENRIYTITKDSDVDDYENHHYNKECKKNAFNNLIKKLKLKLFI